MITSLRIPDELAARLDAVREANAGRVGLAAPSRNTALLLAITRYVEAEERALAWRVRLDSPSPVDHGLNSGLDRLSELKR